MPFAEADGVRIHYKDVGQGFPLFLIPGGGLNSAPAFFTSHAAFDPFEEFSGSYRCVAPDLRNARDGLSSGPLEMGNPWDAFTDDHLRLMDHLGIDRCFVLGFCIGGPLIWNLLRRAPSRVVAAVLADPSGVDPARPDFFYPYYRTSWAPESLERRPDLTMADVETFLSRLYRSNPDFVFTVTRDFARTCQIPLLILPDDIPPHPLATAMDAALLAPNAQASLFPWKHPPDRVPLALRHVRTFLKAHLPGPRSVEEPPLKESPT